MKKQLPIILLLLLCLTITGCRKEPVRQQESTPESPEPTPESLEPASESLVSAPEAPSSAATEEMKRVGNETVGYVSVPSTWVTFKDLNGGTDFQYSDVLGTQIITMNIFDDFGLSESQKAELTAENVAALVRYNLEMNGVEEIIESTGALGAFDTHQLYGLFTSEDHGLASCIVCWVFEDEKGIFHFVSAEAPLESAIEVASYVYDSFTFSYEE